ncbi:MAG: hypothetical protein KDA22_13210 [Phycisphaerales bacterium]|nr:hypothetical protein [Phycisphaerales bacterium]
MHDDHGASSPSDPSSGSPGPPPDPQEALRAPLHWALDSGADPHLAAANWLARDLAPGTPDAITLVSDPTTPLATLALAKEAFKTMRLVGDSARDRRLGGNLYLAAIASALVHHGARISSQSDATLRRALQRLREDDAQPPRLRLVAESALACLPPRSPKTRPPGG